MKFCGVVVAQEVHQWNVEQLRLTAFPTEQVDGKDIPGWSALFNEEPETRVEQGRNRIVEERSSFGNGQLVFRKEPVRCEWRLTPRENWPEFTGVPTVDPLAEVMERFQKPMTAWLELAPSLTRLAFGMVVLQEANDKIEAYDVLRRYLSRYVQIDANNSFDFFYQINRKREFLVGDQNLQINRLSKWAVVELQRVYLGVPTSAPVPGTSFVRLEVDINTAPDSSISGASDLWQPVWSELVKWGVEISEQGDVP